MKVSKALREVWRWKEQVAREIDGMTAEQRIAYFRDAGRRLASKTGRGLKLPRSTGRRRQA